MNQNQHHEKPLTHPGDLLEKDDALDLIDILRLKYHKGLLADYDEHIMENLDKFVRENHNTGRIPKDILQLRLEVFNDRMEKLRVQVGTRPTYFFFPENTLQVTQRILRHPQFQQYSRLYLSVGSLGEKVYRTTPQEISDFFKQKPDWQTPNYYVFDDDVKWCIAITHEDDYL